MTMHAKKLAEQLSRAGEIASPEVSSVNFQVRTGLSMQFEPYMLEGAEPDAPIVPSVRLPVVTSPVVLVWSYQVTNPNAFADWLSTREILLSETRMSSDADLKGIRYDGTYRMVDADGRLEQTYKTLWGFTSEAALQAMQRLCSNGAVPATLLQLELIDFVNGLRRHAVAGAQGISEQVTISAAADSA